MNASAAKNNPGSTIWVQNAFVDQKSDNFLANSTEHGVGTWSTGVRDTPENIQANLAKYDKLH